MPSIQQTLSEEIRRLARKEIKIAFEPIKAQIVHLKKRINELKKHIGGTEKGAPMSDAEEQFPEIESSKKVRVTPKRIKRLREKLGLSQAQFATLLEVSPFSVCHWELGKTVPRDAQKRRIVAIHKLGKRQLKKILEEKKGKVTVESPKAE